MPVSVITNAGVGAWTAAGNSGPLLDVTGCVFGSTLFTIPDEINPSDPAEETFVTLLQQSTLSSLGNIVYTASANQIRYRVINANVVMFQIVLDNSVGNFTFGNFGLLCTANGQQYLFTTTALDQSEIKTSTNSGGLGNYRTYNVLVTLNNVANLSNFTVQLAENASISEVPTETSLPPPNTAPYNLYLVDDYSITSSPALATPVNGNWSFYANLAYISTNYALLNSPQFTGSPEINATAGTNNTALQTPTNLNDSSAAIPNTLWVQGVAALYAPLSGANFTGNVYAPQISASIGVIGLINAGSGSLYRPGNNTYLNLGCDPGTLDAVQFGIQDIDGFHPRWQFVQSSDQETGSNAGSNLLLACFGDSGSPQSFAPVLTVNRASQAVSFSQSPLVPTPPVGDSSNKAVNTAFLTSYGGSVPINTIVMYNSVTGIPPNYALCDGTENTPDLRDRFIMGAGNVSVGLQGGFALQGSFTENDGNHNHSGSDSAVVLSIDQIPSHSHPVTDPGHNHQITKDRLGSGGDPNPVWAGPGFSPDAAITTNTSVTGISVGSTGGNLAHSHVISDDGVHYHNVIPWDNRPPFYALAFIMRVS